MRAGSRPVAGRVARTATGASGPAAQSVTGSPLRSVSIFASMDST